MPVDASPACIHITHTSSWCTQEPTPVTCSCCSALASGRCSDPASRDSSTRTSGTCTTAYVITAGKVRQYGSAWICAAMPATCIGTGMIQSTERDSMHTSTMRARWRLSQCRSVGLERAVPYLPNLRLERLHYVGPVKQQADGVLSCEGHFGSGSSRGQGQRRWHLPLYGRARSHAGRLCSVAQQRAAPLPIVSPLHERP